MSLVRFSYSENPIENLKKKIRHIYDLHRLLENDALREFFESERFDVLLCKVAEDDVVSFRNNNEWLANHPQSALVFSDIENCWSQLKKTYNEDFKGLVYGNFPREEVVLDTLIAIKQRLLSIQWRIAI